mmetsp:Transcript_41225/g.96452  ORF Transcript_41225/g.96452 Transcript_41225/m.96452 type:complete len:231 (-) Transcript_41225:2297-2989(-)
MSRPQGLPSARPQLSTLSLSILKVRLGNCRRVWGPYHFRNSLSASPLFSRPASAPSTSAFRRFSPLRMPMASGSMLMFWSRMRYLSLAAPSLACWSSSETSSFTKATPLPCCSAWKAWGPVSKVTTSTFGTALRMLGSWVPPLIVTTFLPASAARLLMPLSALTSTFWPVTKVVSEKSMTASRSLLCVRDAASRSTWPCCSSGMRAATASCLICSLTPSRAAMAWARSTS